MLHIVLQTEAIAEASSSISLLSMAAKGGWLMLVLLALSIMAVYIFGERMVVLRKAAKVDENFMNNIKEYIYDGKSNLPYICVKAKHVDRTTHQERTTKHRTPPYRYQICY